MLASEAAGLFVGAVALGAVHGIEPGHGWPVAAAYALEQRHRWAAGLAAGLLIGVGHLVSSLAVVGAFFLAKSYVGLDAVNQSVTVGSLALGGPVNIVAGLLLIALGLREYRNGHSHGTAEEPPHGDHTHGDGHGQHVHPEDHDGSHLTGQEPPHERSHEADQSDGLLSGLAAWLPLVGSHSHNHALGDAGDRGLAGIAGAAFLLGFAHEEEFEIIALCAGSEHCLELMTAYALTVVVGILTLTLLLVAGYDRFQERVERYARHLPTVSAVVLVAMGLGFVLGLL